MEQSKLVEVGTFEISCHLGAATVDRLGERNHAVNVVALEHANGVDVGSSSGHGCSSRDCGVSCSPSDDVTRARETLGKVPLQSRSTITAYACTAVHLFHRTNLFEVCSTHTGALSQPTLANWLQVQMLRLSKDFTQMPIRQWQQQ